MTFDLWYTGVRLEDRLYQHLEWSVPPRPRAVELLGDQMTQAGLEIGSNTPYGEYTLTSHFIRYMQFASTGLITKQLSRNT